MGFVSAGKGVVVHRSNCRNLPELRKHPDRCLPMQWAPITENMFPVSLRLMAKNVPGVLANVSTSIGEAGSNIEKVEQPESNPETATLVFTISVSDRDHMARVMRRLRRNKNVLRVNRVRT
jgi:(p)ppGpp synthase/HD superfamily hydrolase